MSEPTTAVPEQATDFEEPGGTEAILLVDDDADVRGLVGTMLRKHGYTVIEAEDGLKAINAAAEYNAPIHLVLTDVVMPELTGRQLFYYLRGWYPQLRVLFMSGYAKGAVAAKELADMATGFIAKPFAMDQLALKVREMLDTPMATEAAPVAPPSGDSAAASGQLGGQGHTLPVP